MALSLAHQRPGGGRFRLLREQSGQRPSILRSACPYGVSTGHPRTGPRLGCTFAPSAAEVAARRYPDRCRYLNKRGCLQRVGRPRCLALSLAAVFFFEIAEKDVQSLDKFMVPGKLAPTLGKAQIADFGCRVAGQFRQMLALGGSVLAMLDSETRSPQYGWPPSQGLPVYVELPNRESIDL
jgi:hypothetical protein